MKQRSASLLMGLLAAGVLACWAFPRFWYTKTGGEAFVWLTESTNLAGWRYE